MSTSSTPNPLPDPRVSEADLLGLVEGTISGARLREIRAAIENNESLRGELARLKRDREALRAAGMEGSPDAARLGALVAESLAAAARSTAGDAGGGVADAVPEWAGDPAPVGGLRAIGEPGPSGSRWGWRSTGALAAVVGVVLVTSFGVTRMLGGLGDERGVESGSSARMTHSPASAGEEARSLEESTSEQIELILAERELEDRLWEMIERRNAEAEGRDDVEGGGVVEVAEGASIDEIFSELARELVEADPELYAGDGAVGDPVVDPVASALSSAGLDFESIGGLANRGSLMVRVVSPDAATVAITLLDTSRGRSSRDGGVGRLSASLLDDGAMSALGVELSGGTGGDGMGDGGVGGLPAYLVSLGGRGGGMDDAALGSRLVGALRGLVGSGDRVRFLVMPSGSVSRIVEAGDVSLAFGRDGGGAGGRGRDDGDGGGAGDGGDGVLARFVLELWPARGVIEPGTGD